MENARTFRVTVVTPEGRHSFECADDEFIWNAAARSGITLPAICHQGRCLTCSAKLIEGHVDQKAAASYFPEDREAGFILLCTALPLSDLVIETHEESNIRQHRKEHNL